MAEEFTAEDLDAMDFSPEELDAMDAKSAPPAIPEEPAFMPSSQAVQNPMELELQGQKQAAAQGISDFDSSVASTVGKAASAVGDFVMGSGVPVPVQLPSSSNPVRQTTADGREIQRYSDGNWYPVGTTFKKPEAKPLGPLQKTMVGPGGKTYTLVDGKYKRVD